MATKTSGLSFRLSSLWALRPDVAAAMQQTMTSLDLDSPPPLGVPEYGYRLANGVAVMHVSGIMTKHYDPWLIMLGVDHTSTTAMRSTLVSAIADESVKSILLVIDSPGGQHEGLYELARDISSYKAVKPIVAYVEDLCCSAAYYAASQCSAIYASGGAWIGCIGTFMVLYDTSQMLEKMGVKAHLVASGPYKGEGTSEAGIPSEHIEDFQRMVTQCAGQFQEFVKSGRKLNPDQIRDVSTGQSWIASEAKTLRLIDAVASLDDTVTVLLNMRASRDDVQEATKPTATDAAVTQEHVNMHEDKTTAVASEVAEPKKPEEKPKDELPEDEPKPEMPEDAEMEGDEEDEEEEVKADATGTTATAAAQSAPAPAPVSRGGKGIAAAASETPASGIAARYNAMKADKTPASKIFSVLQKEFGMEAYNAFIRTLKP